MNAPSVGDAFGPVTRDITVEQIRAYAEASGDDNPIHLDPEAAKASGLPGVIAHGMLVMGLLGSLASDWAGRADLVTRLNCRFAAVVRPGDELSFAGIVSEISDGKVVVDVNVTNQRGEAILSRTQVSYATT